MITHSHTEIFDVFTVVFVFREIFIPNPPALLPLTWTYATDTRLRQYKVKTDTISYLSVGVYVLFIDLWLSSYMQL